MINKMKKEFEKIYNVKCEAAFFSPGRVNLIGEHIDYNGGHVFPCSLDIGTYGVVSRREDNNLCFYSMNFNKLGVIKCNLEHMEYDKNDNWANYLKGVIFILQQEHKLDFGLNILINGNIPNSSGLSSSASIELLMAVIANYFYDLEINQLDLVKIGKKAENEYIGVSCGIMDQFAIGMCTKNHAILIDTNSLEYKHVPLDIEGYKIIIGNTKVQRGLADSKYNERCKECAEALKIINQKIEAKNICDITLEQLESIKPLFANEVIYKRAKHAVSEEQRTILATKALQNMEILEFGELINKSHLSLKNDYEVSCKELDIMVELALKHGAIGARMTGAGFGGCIVSIVPDEKIDKFKIEVEKEYKELTGLAGELYVAVSGDGAKKLEESPIGDLINYGVEKGLVNELDRVFIGNNIASIIGLKEPIFYSDTKKPDLMQILKELVEIAGGNNIIDIESTTECDLLSTEIMGMISPLPSVIINKFDSIYENDKKLATDYFYKLSKEVYYIRTDKIEKNISWVSNTSIGDLKITINLSKPEKDPKAIAAAKNIKSTSFPKCLLCRENEGHKGSLTQPARQNIRLIPLKLENENWFLQYSPYSYFNEHCIILNEKHIPMKIDSVTFKKLLLFLEKFPHYFAGSNADLPIVGGSILSHDHYQGGRDSFPMDNAKPWHKFTLENGSVEGELVEWALSTIRLKSSNINHIVKSAQHILNIWRNYSDESVDIIAKTYAFHNTITPIGRVRNGVYELDLVLRNNRTTPERPYGIFHPHENLHHIKKENIGLIEVMGLAILPARLVEELSDIEEILRDGKPIGSHLDIHKDWILSMEEKLKINSTEDVNLFIKNEVGEKFANVLSDAGVFKQTEIGRSAFLKFVALFA